MKPPTTCSVPPPAPPLPTIVREFQKMIGEEAKAQCFEKKSACPMR